MVRFFFSFMIEATLSGFDEWGSKCFLAVFAGRTLRFPWGWHITLQKICRRCYSLFGFLLSLLKQRDGYSLRLAVVV